MKPKENNEITVKMKIEVDKFYKMLQEKSFKIVDEFSMDDSYFIPSDLEIENMSTREILTKAVLVRKIYKKMLKKTIQKITFKIKNIDVQGKILNQRAINCNILDIEEAKELLIAIGYKEIMNIREDDIVYEKNGLELAIKNIKDGDKLIEIETEDNEKYNTVEKLIKEIEKEQLPIYTDNYFVKKAEIELDKRLNRIIDNKEKACGCIIIEKDKVLLIKQTQGHWGFPKGHVEENETEPETAIREVKEETNMDVEIDASKRYSMEYVTDKGKQKQVVLFVAKYTGGDIKAQESEISNIKWLNFNEAIETITYDNTRELFKKVIEEL